MGTSIKCLAIIVLVSFSMGLKAREKHPQLIAGYRKSTVLGQGKFYRDPNEVMIGHGLIRATLTFATGYMPKNKLNNLYLTGNVEFYTNRKISLRGDAMYFFNSMNGDKTLKKNHSIYSGAAYHFGNSDSDQFDAFIGLQAGLAYTQCGIKQADGSERATAFNPLISPIAGFNYYASRWFHLFINMRYNVGKHLSDDAIIPLSEVNFSFGLGFNINS